MIYELREYVAIDGKAEELHARFRDHTMSIFSRLGIDIVGLWVDGEDQNRVLYLVAFADEAAQSATWAAFQADEEWQEIKARSEAEGPLVAMMTSRMLTNPQYWVGKTVAVNG